MFQNPGRQGFNIGQGKEKSNTPCPYKKLINKHEKQTDWVYI